MMNGSRAIAEEFEFEYQRPQDSKDAADRYRGRSLLHMFLARNRGRQPVLSPIYKRSHHTNPAGLHLSLTSPNLYGRSVRFVQIRLQDRVLGEDRTLAFEDHVREITSTNSIAFQETNIQALTRASTEWAGYGRTPCMLHSTRMPCRCLLVVHFKLRSKTGTQRAHDT
eukprot:1968421-Pyramimonas_sp.AAC.1